MQLYYGNRGKFADTHHAILVDRANAGIRIFVLYDAFGTANMAEERIDSLRRAGVRVEPFRPLRISAMHLAQNRSHARGIVIDGRVGWTGGFGIDDKWMGDGRHNGSWRETNVRFEGPAVKQMQAAFAATWTEATGVLFTGRATEVGYTDGVTAAGLLYATPTLGSTAAERFFAASISDARESLYITNSYFAPDDNMVELLAAVAGRGVDVRLLTAGSRTDVNFDNRSLALNDETTLMILDEQVGQQMVAIFLDDLRNAEEITLERFRQRSWLERPIEVAAKLLTRLL